MKTVDAHQVLRRMVRQQTPLQVPRPSLDTQCLENYFLLLLALEDNLAEFKRLADTLAEVGKRERGERGEREEEREGEGRERGGGERERKRERDRERRKEERGKDCLPGESSVCSVSPSDHARGPCPGVTGGRE